MFTFEQLLLQLNPVSQSMKCFNTLGCMF